MKKKSITCGIILLFLGVSISSGISIDTETTEVEDCGCKEVDDKHIHFLTRRLNRLEVYSRMLVILSKFIPEIEEKFVKIPIDFNLRFKSDGFICDLLWDIIDSIVSFLEKLLVIEYIFKDNPIMLKMVHIIEDMTHIYVILVYHLGGYFDCSWYEPIAIKFLL